MDMDTFLTTLYVWIDEWYTSEIGESVKRKRGPAPEMSDSEVMTVAIAGAWRGGTPWQSERGVVRYMQAHGRQWFPRMLGRSRFNERVRQLWGVLVKLQQALAMHLDAQNSSYEVVDCTPLPSCSTAQSLHKRHWLWWGSRGYGGTNGWYWGDQLLLSVTPHSVITGWLIGPAHVDDRVMLQSLLSMRAGQAEFITPQPWRPWRRLAPPAFMGPHLAAGSPQSARLYLADKGFNGYRWQCHWYQHYCVSVLTAPPRSATPRHIAWPRVWSTWFSSLRLVVETTLATLTTCFDLHHLKAHSRWGQYTRVALAVAAHNWGILLNRQLDRPHLSHATLLL